MTTHATVAVVTRWGVFKRVFALQLYTLCNTIVSFLVLWGSGAFLIIFVCVITGRITLFKQADTIPSWVEANPSGMMNTTDKS